MSMLQGKQELTSATVLPCALSDHPVMAKRIAVGPCADVTPQQIKLRKLSRDDATEARCVATRETTHQTESRQPGPLAAAVSHFLGHQTNSVGCWPRPWCGKKFLF